MGVAAQAIVGGVVDLDDDLRNATIRLTGGGAQCSGTLIAPLLAVTARHCFADKATVAIQLRPGADVAAATGVVTALELEAPWHGNDISIVRLALNPPTYQALAAIRTLRPATTPPPRLANGLFTTTPVEIAGYSRTPRERVGVLNAARRAQARTGAEWNYGSFYDDGVGGAAIEAGDSGGSLVQVLADGSRQLIGVHASGSCSGADPACTATAGEHGSNACDVTAPVIANWIASQATEVRSAAWLSAHGYPRADGRTSHWYGEVDYTGPVDLAHDADGDHWYDNAPVGSPDAGRSHDNCPLHFNPLQENCNQYSEETLGKTVLGDACDPVPCPRVAKVDGDLVPRTCSQRLGYEVCATFDQNDTFHLEPQGPGQGSGVIDNNVPARGFVVPNVPTSMHFCKPGAGPQVNCDDPDAIRDGAIIVPPPIGERVTRARPWVTASRRTAGASETAALAIDYGASFPSIRWDFFADARRWSGQGWIPQPPASPCLATKNEAGKCLGGVIAFHADTEIGKTVRILPGGRDVGLHGGVFGEGRDLSNTFEPVVPIENGLSLRWFGVVPVDALAELRRDPRLAGVMIRSLADPLPGPQYRGRGEWSVGPGHYISLMDFGVDIAAVDLGTRGRLPTQASGQEMTFLSGQTLLSPGVARYVRSSSARVPTTRWVHSHEPRASFGGDVALVLEPTRTGVRLESIRTTSRGTFALASELGEASSFADFNGYGSDTPWLRSPTAQYLFLPSASALFAVEAGHLALFRAGAAPNANVELYAAPSTSTLRSAAYVTSTRYRVANLWVVLEQQGRLSLARYGWRDPLRGATGGWTGGASQLVALSARQVPNDAGGVLLGPVQGNGVVSLLSGGDDQLLVVRNLNGIWRVSALEGNGLDTPFVSRTWVERTGQVVGEPVLDSSGLHLTVVQTSPAAAARSAAQQAESAEGDSAEEDLAGEASSVSLQPIIVDDHMVGLAP